MARSFLPIALTLCSLLVPAEGTAQDPASVAAAQVVFAAADAHFADGEYAQALAQYGEAYELMEGHPNRPLILFNIGRANEELGRPAAAADAFRQFLAGAPADTPFREPAVRRLRELELRSALERSDSQHTSSPSLAPLSISILAVGAAAILAGVVTGSVALSEDSAISAECDASGRCAPELRARAESTQTLANATDGLLVGGAVFAVAGLLLLFLLNDSEDENATTAGLTCTGAGCLAGIRGRF